MVLSLKNTSYKSISIYRISCYAKRGRTVTNSPRRKNFQWFGTEVGQDRRKNSQKTNVGITLFGRKNWSSCWYVGQIICWHAGLITLFVTEWIDSVSMCEWQYAYAKYFGLDVSVMFSEKKMLVFSFRKYSLSRTALRTCFALYVPIRNARAIIVSRL